MDKIKIGISACLLGENVRYDGGHKHDRILTDTLGKHVQYVPVCPEVECGLGVPREAMRLAGSPEAPRLVVHRTGKDVTDRMIRWARRRVVKIEKENLSGFIFKSDSPSCGMERVKVFDEKGAAERKGAGLFAKIFMEHFPLLSVEEEGRLHDPALRENFIERLFALQRRRRENRKTGESRKRQARKEPAEQSPLITGRLLRWYDAEKRNLPWRKTRNPYRIWVSEIMLQQTQVDTVIPYYRRFMKAFPTVKALAGASLDEVLKAWENLGYYSRARNLHAAARVISERFGAKFPAALEEILSLPGVGPYTAGAILSIAYGEPVAAVDGNVRRVIIRIFALKDSPEGQRTQKRIEKLASGLVPEGRAGDFNQALMDLGATICTPQGPCCDRCPVNTLCLAKTEGIQDSIPRAAKRKTLPHKDMTAAVIVKGGRLLIVRRPAAGLLGGLWKLPGGMRGKEESLEKCLRREVREETGFSVRTGEALAKVDHAYTHFKVTLHGYRCTIRKELPRRPGSGEARWIGVPELRTLAFSKADRELIKLVLAGENGDKNVV